MPTGGCTLQPGSEPSRTGDVKSQSLKHTPIPRWPEPSQTDPLAVKTRAFRARCEPSSCLFWGSGVGVFFLFFFFFWRREACVGGFGGGPAAAAGGKAEPQRRFRFRARERGAGWGGGGAGVPAVWTVFYDCTVFTISSRCRRKSPDESSAETNTPGSVLPVPRKSPDQSSVSPEKPR